MSITSCRYVNDVTQLSLNKERYGYILYKNKGDPQKPENYRPITLVSSLGKTFTSIINNRLKTYAENYDLISWSQAGFRKHHSTTDNLFIIKCLIDIVRARKKKLFGCFIDLNKHLTLFGVKNFGSRC